jgi:hypothetical protein
VLSRARRQTEKRKNPAKTVVLGKNTAIFAAIWHMKVKK